MRQTKSRRKELLSIKRQSKRKNSKCLQGPVFIIKVSVLIELSIKVTLMIVNERTQKRSGRWDWKPLHCNTLYLPVLPIYFWHTVHSSLFTAPLTVSALPLLSNDNEVCKWTCTAIGQGQSDDCRWKESTPLQYNFPFFSLLCTTLSLSCTIVHYTFPFFSLFWSTLCLFSHYCTLHLPFLSPLVNYTFPFFNIVQCTFPFFHNCALKFSFLSFPG